MQNKISKDYYPVSQGLFQVPLSRFSPPLSSPLSNWAKKPTLPPWCNILPARFCTGLFAASPDSWGGMSGPWRDSLRSLYNSSSLPYGLKPILCFFLSWMTPSFRRRGKRFQDVPGIKIMLKTWPMSLGTSGYFLSCSIRIFFCLFGLSSTIQREPEDGALFRAKSLWPKVSSEPFNCQSPVSSMFWWIVGIGRKNWLSVAKSVAIT